MRSINLWLLYPGENLKGCKSPLPPFVIAFLFCFSWLGVLFFLMVNLHVTESFLWVLQTSFDAQNPLWCSKPPFETQTLLCRLKCSFRTSNPFYPNYLLGSTSMSLRPPLCFKSLLMLNPPYLCNRSYFFTPNLFYPYQWPSLKVDLEILKTAPFGKV